MLRVRFERTGPAQKHGQKRPHTVAALDLHHDCGHDTFLFPRYSRHPATWRSGITGTRPDKWLTGSRTPRPSQPMAGVLGWLDDQGAERCGELVAAECD